MKLFHRDLGGEGKPPLVILHGLLGSSKNWRTAGADLASGYHVYALDLRNHGESPHGLDQTFESMASDVLEWVDDRRLGRVHWLGHSLGGKLAMRLACRYPERSSALYVVDIAPRSYSVDRATLEVLMGLDLTGIRARADADRALADAIPDRWLRQFLLTNLTRREGGGFAWQANLAVLARDLPVIRVSSLEPADRFLGKTVFIAGERSSFIRPEDEPVIRQHFPYARIEVLAGSGHYPHVDHREGFVRLVLSL
jgi:pimeloyl-ACP methyl ester carboxylesterase